MRPEDEAEFAGLVERQWRFAWRVAWAVLRDTHDAEDAAQEAFLKIWRAKAWRGLRDEKAYVASAAWRTAVDWSSRQARLRRQANRVCDSEGRPVIDQVAAPGLSPEELVAAGDWEAAVHRLIDSLPEELRQVLALSAEMNSREIAVATGIAEGTVRTRLMRARTMLRGKMAALEVRRYAQR